MKKKITWSFCYIIMKKIKKNGPFKKKMKLQPHNPEQIRKMVYFWKKNYISSHVFLEKIRKKVSLKKTRIFQPIYSEKIRKMVSFWNKKWNLSHIILKKLIFSILKKTLKFQSDNPEKNPFLKKKTWNFSEVKNKAQPKFWFWF